MTITLGDIVIDTVSGFKGVAVARHHYLQGCDRITVQPPIDKDGKLPEGQTFDEPLLQILMAGKVKRSTDEVKPGGPEKWSDNRRY